MFGRDKNKKRSSLLERRKEERKISHSLIHESKHGIGRHSHSHDRIHASMHLGKKNVRSVFDK